MHAKQSTLRILVVDDVAQVRQTVKGFLAADGYNAEEAGTARELIRKFAQQTFDLVLLDITLANDRSIEDTRALVRESFPGVNFPHAEILEDLGAGPRETVSGLYLLPVIKAVSPRTKVIMLTADWEGEQVEQYLRKWGSEVTVLKCSEDRNIRPGQQLFGLGAELRGFVDGLAKAQVGSR